MLRRLRFAMFTQEEGRNAAARANGLDEQVDTQEGRATNESSQSLCVCLFMTNSLRDWVAMEVFIQPARESMTLQVMDALLRAG